MAASGIPRAGRQPPARSPSAAPTIATTTISAFVRLNICAFATRLADGCATNSSASSKPIRRSARFSSPFAAKKIVAGGPNDAEALQQRLIGVVVRGDVGLQQHEVDSAVCTSGLRERELLHFLAADAPVGVEIEHDRLVGGFRGGELAIEIVDRFDRAERERGLRRRAFADPPTPRSGCGRSFDRRRPRRSIPPRRRRAARCRALSTTCASPMRLRAIVRARRDRRPPRSAARPPSA